MRTISGDRDPGVAYEVVPGGGRTQKIGRGEKIAAGVGGGGETPSQLGAVAVGPTAGE